VPVAHVCNPSYSGGREPEDHGLKLARENGSRDLIWKKPITHTQNKGWQDGSRLIVKKNDSQ
jgi:hypothetical protein